MNKLDKLQKLRRLWEGSEGPESELAKQRYTEFKAKYHLEDVVEAPKVVKFYRGRDNYEYRLLMSLGRSFGLLYTFRKRNNSKHNVGFECSEDVHLAIKDDFEYHRAKLRDLLMGTALRYVGNLPDMVSDEDSEAAEQGNVKRRKNNDINPDVIEAYHSAHHADAAFEQNKKKLTNRK